MNQYYTALADLANLIASSRPLNQLLQDACECITAHTQSAVTYIVSVDPATSGTSVLAAAGESLEFLRGQPISIESDQPGGMGLAAQTYRKKAPLVFNDLATAPVYAPSHFHFEKLGLAAAVGIPLMNEGGCRAVLGLVSKERGHFTSKFVTLIKRMGDMLSAAIKYADERELSNRYFAFYAALADLNDLVANGSEPEVLFKKICELITNLSPHLCAAVIAREKQGDDYQLKNVYPNVKGQFSSLDIDAIWSFSEYGTPNDQNLVTEVLRNKKSVYWDQHALAACAESRMKALWKAGSRSLLATPILAAGEQCEGVLFLGSSRSDYFNKEIQNLAERLSGNLGQAIVSRRQRLILERQALMDLLTEMPNRALLMNKLDQAIIQADRNTTRLGVAVIDIDEFKEINDQFGHLAGDEAIRAVARTLTENVRGADTIARLDGDEFAALFNLGNDESVLEAKAQKLMDAIKNSVRADGELLSVSASVGFALFPEHGATADDLLRRAHLAMYHAKQQGGNSWCLFKAEDEENLKNRHRLRTRFERAITDGEIDFYYQPKVDMCTGNILGAEALARWHCPDEGLLPPYRWIPVVETNAGLCSALGRHALASVIKQLRAWSDKGLDIPISLNISAGHLQMPSFLADVQHAIEQSSDLARSLCLEVTETALIHDFDRLRETLTACRKMGLRVALDDFGTGYASLAYLQKLPADAIKIDLQFVLNMPWDMRAFSIVAGTLQISQMSGMEVIAEGVETEEHGVRLIQLGCNRAQGYAISPALPARAFEQWLNTWKAPSSWNKERLVTIVPTRHRLLASLVYHRSRQKLIADANSHLGEPDDLLQAQCPILRQHTFSKPRASEPLEAVHDALHRMEDDVLHAIMQGTPASKSDKQKLGKRLTDYERLIDTELGE